MYEGRVRINDASAGKSAGAPSEISESCLKFAMSVRGQTRRFDDAPIASGLPLSTDIGDTGRHAYKGALVRSVVGTAKTKFSSGAQLVEQHLGLFEV
jgi:hypothetical protein